LLDKIYYSLKRNKITVKYDVMLKILTLLLQKRRVTAGELADRYEVSVRSIYRYIEELCVCGVPVQVDRGRYGGIYLPDTYRLPTGYFTREEYAATLNALNVMAMQIPDEAVISAKEKLESADKRERRELSVCGNIIVDGGSWGDSGSFSEKMHICERAVNASESLLIDYISREGEHSRRIIDPHVLIFKQNVWYVYAYCHTKQDFRTFKIGRIKNATFTGKTFIKREIRREDIPLNFFYSSEQLINVTLEIKPSSLADAEEWLGIDNIEPRENGLIANVTLPDDDGLVNKILGYGGAVKVLAPQTLKEKVKKVAENIAEQI